MYKEKVFALKGQQIKVKLHFADDDQAESLVNTDYLINCI